ncbi:hypothetical protein [Polaribacter sp. L3A8]|uniref:hypothetical protein n=1 Tax=Polaribacter sp. L3A8 TaxID=2686361 RepID=UPI00131D799C|nr:hypothetical protein [Polaribacter sp. L3A8]
MNNNIQINFSLKGITSILIGAFIFVASYLIETILNGFLIDDNPLGMLSAETLEILIITITIFAFLFSSLTLFFNGKRTAKKQEHKLWSEKTKAATKKYFLGIIIIFASLLILMNLGFIDYITPTFLILYAVLLFVFKNKERKNLLILSGVSILLAVMCFLIPTYWASSLSILGIAHVAYGVVVKE